MYSLDQDTLQFHSDLGWLGGQFCGVSSEDLIGNWNKDSSEDFIGNWNKESVVPVLGSLLLNDENVGELCEPSGGGGGGVINTISAVVPMGAKPAASMRSHSDAERRRRERINSRLATLRGLVPSSIQLMEKAALLAEVVKQVKQMKKTATEASKGLFIPTDSDEIQVEYLPDHNVGEGAIYFRASICFESRREFFTELKRTIATLPVSLVKSEISTLANRVKYDMLFKCVIQEGLKDKKNSPEALKSLIQKAFSSIFDKISLILEYSPRAPRTMASNKRQKVSHLHPSSSSS